MYIYKVTFLGGATAQIRANSPKEAFKVAFDRYQLEVIRIKYLRG